MSTGAPLESKRRRIRQVLPNLYLGKWPTGRLNSLTDVPGVLVYTQSVRPDSDVNTGVTAILPRKDWHEHSSFAGVFRFNGCGEMTGAHWINEAGVLSSPIIITATSSVGEGYRGVTEYCYRNFRKPDGEVDVFMLPVVAETYDGYLSDPARFAVTPQHVMDGIEKASADAVQEGNTGGGTGMICHGWKGGTGSSSRLVQGLNQDGKEVTFTVGALVQANYGSKDSLRIGGIPVGWILKNEQDADEIAEGQRDGSMREPRKDGSIIIILATNAPLVPIQLQRLARRAAVGLSKVGGYGHNSSGDIFLAFSTGNKISSQILPTPKPQVAPESAQMIGNSSIDSLFVAAADAVEEAIYNALFMAETTTGFKGRTIEAIDLDKVKRIVEKRL
ncbi:hypothetical protein HIM_05926 [Hirsutella minnesotensis 3608]|uniref:Beta-peptidyl aminopeptidase BapA n=1 Tax=Hirsutella minnesotensis 3608 TaxID=1043627 RepID=A0A0F7ZJN6_9HYPO|nr:hypothetical protein HIM_05926 [Hirsutella minnesotensis 3608]